MMQESWASQYWGGKVVMVAYFKLITSLSRLLISEDVGDLFDMEMSVYLTCMIRLLLSMLQYQDA